MKRRQFVQITGLSLGGVLVIPQSAGFLFSRNNLSNLWEQFQKIAGTRLLWPASEAHQMAVDQILQLPAYRKYHIKPGSWRSYGEGRYACCTIELKHAQTGVLDLSVLVFEKKEDDLWEQVAVLSSYHLEAISCVIERGSMGTATADYIIPVGHCASGPCMGSFYHTANGIFGVTPQVTPQGMEITAMVYDKKGGEVFKYKQQSAHQLV